MKELDQLWNFLLDFQYPPPEIRLAQSAITLILKSVTAREKVFHLTRRKLLSVSNSVVVTTRRLPEVQSPIVHEGVIVLPVNQATTSKTLFNPIEGFRI